MGCKRKRIPDCAAERQNIVSLSVSISVSLCVCVSLSLYVCMYIYIYLVSILFNLIVGHISYVVD